MKKSGRVKSGREGKAGLGKGPLQKYGRAKSS